MHKMPSVNSNPNSTNLITKQKDTESVTPLAPDWFRYSLLFVCLVGICGNLLNLIVLTRRRLVVTLSFVERSSSRTLIAIALADLLFCCIVLPAVFYTDEPYTQPEHKLRILYYKVIHTCNCFNKNRVSLKTTIFFSTQKII